MQVVEEYDCELLLTMLLIIYKSSNRGWFGIENLDKLVIIMKNQSNDLVFGFKNGPKSLKEDLDIENNMVSKTKKFIVYFNLFKEY